MKSQIIGVKLDWECNDYGKLAFPDSTNYYGAPSAVFKATRTPSAEAGFRYWYDSLVASMGEKEARAERDRTLTRGATIDWTADRYIDQIGKVRDMVGNFATLEQINEKLFDGKADNRVVSWLVNSDIVIIANEIPLWSRKRGIKGYIDLLAIVNGELVIIDFKGANRCKSPDKLDENFQQVSNYMSCLKEMWQDINEAKDNEADKLLGDITLLSDELVYNVKGMLLHFVDGVDEAKERYIYFDDQRSAENDVKNVRKDSRWRDDWKFHSADWQLERFAKKMTKFWSYNVIFLCDGMEGFYRRKWKRVAPNKILTPIAFKEMKRLANGGKQMAFNSAKQVVAEMPIEEAAPKINFKF